MSLRDTLEGAREEIAQQRAADKNLPSRNHDEEKSNKKDRSKAKEERSEETAPTGFEKRSATRAKPAREAAQGVRVVAAGPSTKAATKSTSNLTREQRKQQKMEEERNRDRLATATNIVLAKDPLYRKRRIRWWIMVIVGLVMTACSFVVLYIAAPAGASTDVSTAWGMFTLVSLILAYGGIIGGLIYDLVRIRPLRRAADDKCRGMSVKRLDAIIKEDIAERRARRHRKGKKGGSAAA